MKVYPIVEGHGEVEAVPVLLRRLLAEAQCQHIGVGRPIRRTQSQLRSEEGNRSFRKMVKALGDVLAQLRQPIPAWPPAGWQAE
ncbi:MAG: hypothetical protein H7A46_14250 [Verrucomicrobiales bacterium]|nr:hypothetical protein [Verrucomicrobiales bacterium]